ncbi:hypothetical protein [Pedobacter heparinus]|uniref:hypothetical protein n=1 Tax=Pedobacter heparinus TaxID=984 RepID=UPI00292E3D8A|nr:hypothetical protein [Pedobacter heparinus]
MKPLFYFKNSEFEFIGYRFFFLAIFLLLFYKGTYCHDRGEILIYSLGENNLKTNLKADHDKYRVVNNQLAATYNTASKISVLNARKKAEVYFGDFMTLFSAYGLIFQKTGT